MRSFKFMTVALLGLVLSTSVLAQNNPLPIQSGACMAQGQVGLLARYGTACCNATSQAGFCNGENCACGNCVEGAAPFIYYNQQVERFVAESCRCKRGWTSNIQGNGCCDNSQRYVWQTDHCEKCISHSHPAIFLNGANEFAAESCVCDTGYTMNDDGNQCSKSKPVVIPVSVPKAPAKK
jgi:hypothetical protein